MIDVGILGGGNISETHARAVQEASGFRVAALYGPNREKAARLGQLYGGAVYDDLPQFFAHKPMSIVLIGSPSGLHAEQGIMAARHGLHVLVEKPIDVTTAQADLLIAEAARAGVKLGVFYQDRVAPDICKMKEVVDGGHLGRPILVSGRVKWYRPPEYYSESRWRDSWALSGGGALINQGVHTVDLLLWLLGDVERVYAVATTMLHSIEVEDTIVATLEFVNGATGTLEVATSVYPGYSRRVELTGTEGTIILEHDRLIAADLRANVPGLVGPMEHGRGESAASPVVSDVSGHKKLLEDFRRAIETDSRPRCDGHEGRRSVELVEAIYESSRTGQPVRLPTVIH